MRLWLNCVLLGFVYKHSNNMLLEILLPESFYWYLLTHCFIMSHILKILHVYYVSYLTIAYLVTVSL